MEKHLKDILDYAKGLKLLLVEDDTMSMEQSLNFFNEVFTDIITAHDGYDGYEKFKSNEIDIVITDVEMPRMNGLEMSKKIKELNKDIPIIIISGYNDAKYLLETIKMGINSYIVKPINLIQFMDTLSNVVEKVRLKDELEQYKQKLEKTNKALFSLNDDLEVQMMERIGEIYALNQEILATQKEVIFTMGTIGESRCNETGAHVKRVAEYSKIFAIHYGLGEEEAEMLKEVSPMHDIGKVAIADSILHKKGKLTDEEMDIMRTHTTLGYGMLSNSKRKLLKVASTVAYEHHEKYDGSGYPRGLKGEDISIYGRITAIADVFDALGSSRVYKPAWDDEEIFNMFNEQSGKHFDPKLIDIFFDNLDEFLAAREKLS
ncbi:MAG: response regulator [Campylobacterota bacterium]|nr:response regulator [Campylobacterota bacterium]